MTLIIYSAPVPALGKPRVDATFGVDRFCFSQSVFCFPLNPRRSARPFYLTFAFPFMSDDQRF